MSFYRLTAFDDFFDYFIKAADPDSYRDQIFFCTSILDFQLISDSKVDPDSYRDQIDSS